MAKKPVQFVLPVINSMQDVGYQQAKLGNTMRYIAIEAMNREPELPETFSEDGKTQYLAGVDLCYNDLHPAKTYFRLDGNWLPAESFADGADVSSLETRQVGVTCMLLTGQEYGALNNSKSGTYDASLYQVVGAWREKVKKYRHNKVKDLIVEIKKIQAEGKPRTRAQRDDFREYLKSWFDTAEKRCKVSTAQHSDTTADLARYKQAKQAFLDVYDQGQDC